MDIEENVVNNDVNVYLLASSLAHLYNSGAVLKYKISTVGKGGPNGRGVPNTADYFTSGRPSFTVVVQQRYPPN